MTMQIRMVRKRDAEFVHRSQIAKRKDRTGVKVDIPVEDFVAYIRLIFKAHTI